MKPRIHSYLITTVLRDGDCAALDRGTDIAVLVMVRCVNVAALVHEMVDAGDFDEMSFV